RQLTEYQAFKEAALKLDSRLLLGRDTFKREAPLETVEADEDEALVELNVFDLVAAFQRIVSSLKKEEILEIEIERMSLSDRINEIMERLQEEKDVTFLGLLGESPSRRLIVYTFLAVLELMKLRLVRAFQASPFGPIRLFLAVEEG
ncbi:MAG TPA: segregation/condensation protein A, partial [Syntrophales bacterium]|nr:segregation/condensation protein A [Syntrophales bacterium]